MQELRSRLIIARQVAEINSLRGSLKDVNEELVSLYDLLRDVPGDSFTNKVKHLLSNQYIKEEGEQTPCQL